MSVHDLERLREARMHDLRVENVRLKEALTHVVMTLNRSDPFFTVFMAEYGDLVPIQSGQRDDAA